MADDTVPAGCEQQLAALGRAYGCKQGVLPLGNQQVDGVGRIDQSRHQRHYHQRKTGQEQAAYRFRAIESHNTLPREHERSVLWVKRQQIQNE